MNYVKNSIGWADWSWNPVTGCKRGCTYCYARRINDRFFKQPFNEIVYHEDRLNEPSKLKKPSIIFVGSMSDIEYWNVKFTKKIIDICTENQHHTFMFLSKEPSSYCDYFWPVNTVNTMQGLTLTCIQTIDEQFNQVSIMELWPHPYISIEPILGELKVNLKCMEKVIVGAMTGHNAVIPKQEWIQSIKDNVPSDKIFWKENIKQYLK